jgi:hypothetical protein
MILNITFIRITSSFMERCILGRLQTKKTDAQMFAKGQLHVTKDDPKNYQDGAEDVCKTSFTITNVITITMVITITITIAKNNQDGAADVAEEEEEGDPEEDGQSLEPEGWRLRLAT